MVDRKMQMQDAAMDVVAEKGLDGFTMKQIPARIGVSEPLLYKYFDTKDNLLLQCFLTVNRQIADLFVNVQPPEQQDLSTRFEFVRQQWERYFRFMVANGNRSLFYYAYRDSTYLQKVLMKNNPEVAQDMQSFMTMIRSVAEGQLNTRVPTDYIWLYLLESTGNFVKYIIRNQMPMDEVDVDSIWQLISGGLRGLVK